mgnify:CR=1 FL=1
MKKLLLMLFMCAPVAALAQKFGHVNAQDIIQVMPEYTKAKTEIAVSYTHLRAHET